jgi:hypothetical protein
MSVEQLRPVSKAKDSEVAVGTVMEFAIGNGRTLQLSSCFGRDDTIEVWNDVLDRMRAAGERQAWITDLRKAEDNLLAQQRELRNVETSMAISEADYQATSKARGEKIAELRFQASDTLQLSEAEWAQGDKRGTPRLSNETKQRMAGYQSQIERLEQEQKAMDLERANAIKSTRHSIFSFTEQMKDIEADMERLRAKLGM